MPKLRTEVERQAAGVECGAFGFGVAHAAVMGVAISCGALYLSDDKLDELDDWISSALLIALDAASDRSVTVAEEAERRRQDDPIAYYEDLASHCSNPKAMRWVFAALSPEYRNHLLAQVRGAP